MRRALVTGAGGFVGANLARRLLTDGHDVHLAIAPGGNRWRLEGLDAPTHEVDIADAAAVTRLVVDARAEWVFHLAAHGAYSWQTDAGRIADVNVQGTANLLDAALAAGFDAFVNAGSSSEYGFKVEAPLEDEPVEPASSYAEAKVAATALLRDASIAHGVSITTLRLYSIYGPYEDQRRLIPALVINGLQGRLPPLVDPAIARDFVHVDDAVEAFVLAATEQPMGGAVLNVATGTQTTVGDAVAVARRVLSIDEEPVWGSLPPRVWDTTTWVGDSTRARETLGWLPAYDFDRGFGATVDWARARGWPA